MKRIILIFSVLSIIMVVLAFILWNAKKPEPEKKTAFLAERKISEIEEIKISNQYDSYSVNQIEGGFAIADLPMELVFKDYLLMLLDEAARVEYVEQVCPIKKTGQAEQLALYGLDKPLATIVIRYTTGDILTLLFGSEEPLSRGQYFMAGGGDAVYLMDHSRVVRFLQPLRRFISLEIVPVRSAPSPLSTIKNLTLSGKAFPQPVVISGIDSKNEEEMREAMGFGAVTHIIKSPHVHGIDQKEAIDVFGSLSGLLNIEVLAYNADDSTLSNYGFDDPLVRAEYDYQKGDGSAPVRIVLRTVLYRGEYLLVRDNQRVIHRMEKKAFMDTSYEKLVSRWFLSPFITDVRSIDLRCGSGAHRFELSGDNNRSLAASLDGLKLDIDRFRKFYTLLISASNDGVLLKDPVPAGPPVLAVTFHYRDTLKKDDTMVFSPGSLRRHYVSVNGVTEFGCQERYVQVVETALEALQRGEDFRTDW